VPLLLLRLEESGCETRTKLKWALQQLPQQALVFLPSLEEVCHVLREAIRGKDRQWQQQRQRRRQQRHSRAIVRSRRLRNHCGAAAAARYWAVHAKWQEARAGTVICEEATEGTTTEPAMAEAYEHT
jgi:hypothetical protein